MDNDDIQDDIVKNITNFITDYFIEIACKPFYSALLQIFQNYFF